MTIRDAAGNALVAGFTGQVYTVGAITDSGMYRPQFPATFAADTAGGRGGTIYRINTLSDNNNAPVAVGDGTFRCSLRAALLASGPRIIVFEISGTFSFTDGTAVNVENGFLTVAGQTAPSPGVTIRTGGLAIYANDCVFQHIRFRPGNDGPLLPQTANHDALLIYNGFGFTPTNIILDHCSMSWAGGKNFDIAGYANTNNLECLMWRCINSEALFHASNVIVDAGQPSSLGALLVGNPTGRLGISIVQCLYAHNSDRNPEIHEAVDCNFINNIIYDWGKDSPAAGGNSYEWASFFYGVVPNFWRTNIISNVYIAGTPPHPFTPLYAIGVWAGDVGSELFIDDNARDQTLATVDEFFLNPSMFDPRVGAPPITIAPFTILPSGSVKAFVLANAGARPLDRDAIDTRIVNDVTNYTGTVISAPSQVGGYPTLAVNNRVFTVPSNPNGISPLRGAPFTIIEDTLELAARGVEP